MTNEFRRLSAPRAFGTLAPIRSQIQANRTALATLPGIILGSTSFGAQHGILGKQGPLKVAIDLDGCNTISLFGVQGFGKSYTLGCLAEMATSGIHGINTLPAPLATVMFHYHPSDVYEPELLAGIEPNAEPSEVQRLATEYGATPAGLADVILLVPEAKMAERQREYPSVEVRAIKFSSRELQGSGWKFLLGAYGNDALYLRQLSAILSRLRGELTLESLTRETETSSMAPAIRQLIADRLRLAEPFIDDAQQIGDLLRPGRTIIVDLRDPWIEKTQALELFVVLMQIFASAGKAPDADGNVPPAFNRLVIFDEAHKYIEQGEIVSRLVETIREMRHHATSVIIASQDPLSVPRVVIELSTVLVLHRLSSPAWVKHLKTAILALEYLDEKALARLEPGEALVWAQKSNSRNFSNDPQKIVIRPRVTAHGGGTKMATRGARTAT